MVEAARHAVRLSGTEFTLFDEDFHEHIDVVWKLDEIHDGAARLTSSLPGTGIDDQVFPLSRRDCILRRRDGFVSMTAGEKVGQLITKPFTATGDQLLLNVDVHDGGNTKVEVLDEDRNPIRGFELSGSVSLRGRAIEQKVQWTTNADWRQLAGRELRLRIRLRNADLYAFWPT